MRIEVWEVGAGKAEDRVGREAQWQMNLEHSLKSGELQRQRA